MGPGGGGVPPAAFSGVARSDDAPQPTTVLRTTTETKYYRFGYSNIHVHGLTPIVLCRSISNNFSADFQEACQRISEILIV